MLEAKAQLSSLSSHFHSTCCLQLQLLFQSSSRLKLLNFLRIFHTTNRKRAAEVEATSRARCRCSLCFMFSSEINLPAFTVIQTMLQSIINIFSNFSYHAKTLKIWSNLKRRFSFCFIFDLAWSSFIQQFDLQSISIHLQRRVSPGIFYYVDYYSIANEWSKLNGKKKIGKSFWCHAFP